MSFKRSDLLPVYLDIGHYVHAEVGVGVLGGLDAGLELLHHVLLFGLGDQENLDLRPRVGGEEDEGEDGGGDEAQHPAPKTRLVAPPRERPLVLRRKHKYYVVMQN